MAEQMVFDADQVTAEVAEGIEKIQNASNLEELKAIKTTYAGADSAMTKASKAIGSLPADQKKEAGVKRIRIHDLRHSHVSLLIEMGFSALAIADRVGHESVDITYKYAHLFPSKQQEMAQKLNMERKEG